MFKDILLCHYRKELFPDYINASLHMLAYIGSHMVPY